MWRAFLFLILLISLRSIAQDVAIGQWRAHLPYSKLVAVSATTNDVYCGTTEALFVFHQSDGSMDRFSTVNGLSDVGLGTLRFNPSNNKLLIAYANANMDIMSNGSVVNISDIQRTNIIGDKSINDIHFDGDLAYLSCGFGIVVLDMARYEIKDTYYVGVGGDQIRVNDIITQGSEIFAATEDGVISADLTNPFLADPTSWTWHTNGLKANTEADHVVFWNSKFYAAVNDSIFRYDDTVWTYFSHEDNRPIESLEASNGLLFVCMSLDTAETDGKVRVFDSGGLLVDLTDANSVLEPNQATADANGNYWIADGRAGLVKYDGAFEQIAPNGPPSKFVREIGVYDETVWVAAGSITNIWTYLQNSDGFFQFSGNWWQQHAYYNQPGLDTIFDFITVAYNEETEHVFFGSFGGGVVEFYNGKVVNVYEGNSSLQPAAGDPTSYRIGGMTFDDEGNLWVTNFGAPSPISVLKPDGTWQAFTPPSQIDLGGDFVGQIVIDDQDQKWIQLPKGKGLLVFWEGDDMASSSDDKWRVLSTGEEQGGLPDNNVLSLARDLDGEIWVGTNQGIGVFYCAADVLSSSGCDAERILVKEGEHFAYLMETEFVNSIAVDGADRKWIGTTNGVFLMSSDGTEKVSHFNEQNSPLLSDEIVDIAVDPKTGEVYFGTVNGIISYKGTATEGGDVHDDVYVYPNPVTPGYTGTIAVKGLVRDAYVKITDVAGALIYETRALGGQAVWNGRNYNGDRARSGVYLVFSTNQDGTETFVTKFVIVN
jgi:sugar lactone lactonase YvrE